MFLLEILGIQAHQIVLVYRVHPNEKKKEHMKIANIANNKINSLILPFSIQTNEDIQTSSFSTSVL